MSSCLDLDDLEFGFNKHAPKIEKKTGKHSIAYWFSMDYQLSK